MPKKLFLSSIVLTVLLSLCFVTSVEADVSGWSQTYVGLGDSCARSVIATSDGGFALAGETESFGVDFDFWLVKTDESGNMEWNRTYGGTGYDIAYSLVETVDGYAIAGTTMGHFWLVKTDENGIVPEYSSWLLPSLLLVATLVIMVCKKKLLKQTLDT